MYNSTINRLHGTHVYHAALELKNEMRRKKNVLSAVNEEPKKSRTATKANSPKRTQRNAAKIAISMISESMKMENCGNRIRIPAIFDPNQMLSVMDIYKANLSQTGKKNAEQKTYKTKSQQKKKPLNLKQPKEKQTSKSARNKQKIVATGPKKGRKKRISKNKINRKSGVKLNGKTQSRLEPIVEESEIEEIVPASINGSSVQTSDDIEPIFPINPFMEMPIKKISIQGLSSLDLDMCDSDTEHYNVNYSKQTIDWFKARDYDSKNARNPLLLKLFCTKPYTPTTDELFKLFEENHLLRNSSIWDD